MRAILAQAVADSRIMVNPADHVKLPTERSAQGGTPGVVDDPNQFLTAQQVSALVAATPWPLNVYIHLAAWSGLRAGELAGLQVGDVELPDLSINPNAQAKPGTLRVDRTVITLSGELAYDSPKTKGSRRRVPLTGQTTELLRDYLASHPRADDPNAPLFCAVTLKPSKPTGKPGTDWDGKPKTENAAERKLRQATALASLSVDDAASRLELDWSSPLAHQSFYQAVFRPAVLRANGQAQIPGDRVGASGGDHDPLRFGDRSVLPPGLTFHALRHTYASLCVAAGIPPLQLSRFMGHAKVTTTLNIYSQPFPRRPLRDDGRAGSSQPTG